MTDQEKFIHNEQVRLRALFVNNIAVAVIAGGAFAGAWQTVQTGRIPPVAGLVELFALMAGVGLHCAARRHLKRLQK